MSYTDFEAIEKDPKLMMAELRKLDAAYGRMHKRAITLRGRIDKVLAASPHTMMDRRGKYFTPTTEEFIEEMKKTLRGIYDTA